MQTIYRLKKNEFVKLDRFTGAIFLKSGSAWITQANDVQDHIFEQNFKRQFDAKNLLIQGLSDSELLILETRRNK